MRYPAHEPKHAKKPSSEIVKAGDAATIRYCPRVKRCLSDVV
jgi:hypothetical protein